MKKTRLVQMLENAVQKDGGSEAQFATKHDLSQQTFNTWMKGRVPTRQFRRKIASILNISDDMMAELVDEAEAMRSDSISAANRMYWKEARAKLEARSASRAPGSDTPTNGTLIGSAPSMSMEAPVPVYGRAVGGAEGEYEFNGQILDWVARPPSLAGVKDAYAVFVDGESMVPAYKPGQTAWVHPTRPARRGDDVVVQLHGSDEHAIPRGYIKEFVGYTPTKLVLQQHNPSKKIEFDRQMVKTVDTIVFSERA